MREFHITRSPLYSKNVAKAAHSLYKDEAWWVSEASLVAILIKLHSAKPGCVDASSACTASFVTGRLQ